MHAGMEMEISAPVFYLRACVILLEAALPNMKVGIQENYLFIKKVPPFCGGTFIHIKSV